MGCFDSSCAISNIAVGSGDKVVRVFLCSTSRLRDFANMRFGGQWNVLALPIRGEYNDYGDIENISKGDIGQAFIEGPLMELFKDVTPPSFRERNGGLERFKDEAHCGHQTLPDRWVYGKKNIWVEEEACGFKYQKLKEDNGSAVGAAFIHLELWDHICSLGPIKDIDSEVDEFLAARKEYFAGRQPSDAMLVHLEMMDTERRRNLTEEDMIRLAEAFERHTPMGTNFLSRALTVDPVGISESGTPIYIEVARKILNMVDTFNKTGQDYKKTPIRAILASVCELVNFYCGADGIGKSIEPPVSRGSQHQQVDEAIDTHDFLLKAADVQRKKILKRYKGEPLSCYFDKDDPLREKLVDLCPELDNSQD